MIEEILPPGVCSADTRGEFPESLLLPGERHAVRDAVERRRREYTTARVCAHRALADLGAAPGPVLSGTRGEPLWPLGVVGSLTHCEGYRAAAVGRAGGWLALGIDAEPHAALPDGVEEAVTLPEERVRLRELSEAEPGIRWDRLLFSAKESVYKAWYPLAARRLDFRDASLRICPRARTFSARLTPPWAVVGDLTLDVLTGEWSVRDGLVLTSVALRAPAGPPGP
ncbi:4'-phosphopantetheinyl transferase family protein [Nocardiopsis lucentensis]|uniref:4'-phosphopantetheinyl transferase family protein n=1 Tax=Nocardiopsis lucentensis TaxID=53441 RepID=UPI000344C484|nr:4'-phosphopantetheinyl transferase superfamily protein [Nocardiopsis lucentensis]